MSWLHKLLLQEFTMHDTIGCFLDIDKGQIKFSKNGKFYSLSFFRILLGCLYWVRDREGNANTGGV